MRYFIALAEELNFTRAAAQLHLAQQGLSMAIRQMEQRLGAALFERSTRSVSLTAAGEALLPHARKALAAADAGQAAVGAVMRGERGHLRIGFCATSALDLTPKLLRTFTERYPNVSLSVRHFGFEDPTGGLRDGSSDVALVRPPFNADGLVLIDVLREARWVVLPTAHRLANAKSVAFAELVDEPWIDAQTDPAWCSFWSCDELRDRPVTRGPACHSYDELFEAVRAELAVALVPESLVATHQWPGLSFAHVTDIPPTHVAIARPSEAVIPAARLFLALALDLSSVEPPPALG